MQGPAFVHRQGDTDDTAATIGKTVDAGTPDTTM